MIKRYPWHFLISIFIILALANIFQKLRWNEAHDHIIWNVSERGLICVAAPAKSPIQKGDILLAINGYAITNRIDYLRVIEQKNYCYYRVERQGIINDFGIDIDRRFTPFNYYILVFCGIILILLTLGILNIYSKRPLVAPQPKIFFWLSLSLSGFLIFSPTGAYSLPDFLYLALDNVSYLFFPALLLHYSLQYPRRSRVLRGLPGRYAFYLFYLAPLTLLVLNILFVAGNLVRGDPELLTTILNHFRRTGAILFSFYIFLSLGTILSVNLSLIIRKKIRKYIMPLAGIVVSLLSIFILNLATFNPAAQTTWLSYLLSFTLVFLPLSLVYMLSQRRFTDIEVLIKKTLSISSIFIFIFGAYLFLGLNIEQNKILGIFWSIAAILMAGLLFKPIETNIQKYFEKVFYRETFNFRRKLKELESSISTQRDLVSLAVDFLGIINRGFQLQTSALVIYYSNNIFYSLPDRGRLFLSQALRRTLISQNQLVFLSDQEFKTKFPKDSTYFLQKRLYQFLPLKISEKLVGMVAFGRKIDHTYLSMEDWELVSGISASLALSVENAFLYSQLENRLRELNLLSQFNESIIENINLGIVVLSSRNHIKTWNRFMEIKFGIKRERALTKNAADVLGPQIWERIGQSKRGVSTISNVKIPRGEDQLIFDIGISPLGKSGKALPDRILLFEDVTEKVAIQNQLITSEKMASLGLLSAGVAHEINTPLTGISSFCQLLLDRPHELPGNLDLIQKIQDQVQRANKIIRTLLDFSRQKAEKPVEINLNNVIEESLSLVEHQLKKKQITLQKDFHFQNSLVGFPTHLQQMFINLFLNSFDAVEEKGLIAISGAENKDGTTVSIHDNGRGIREKHLPKIFDPFFTTKEIGRGTGLGLSIVYNIVKEHYGEIKVLSKPHRGTTFSIFFPRENPLRRMKI